MYAFERSQRAFWDEATILVTLLTCYNGVTLHPEISMDKILVAHQEPRDTFREFNSFRSNGQHQIGG